MLTQLIQIGASLGAILLVSWLCLKLGLGADVRIRDEDHARRLADEANLDPEFAEKFLTFIVSEVVRHHERIARSAG